MGTDGFQSVPRKSLGTVELKAEEAGDRSPIVSFKSVFYRDLLKVPFYCPICPQNLRRLCLINR